MQVVKRISRDFVTKKLRLRVHKITINSRENLPSSSLRGAKYERRGNLLPYFQIPLNPPFSRGKFKELFKNPAKSSQKM